MEASAGEGGEGGEGGVTGGGGEGCEEKDLGVDGGLTDA